MLPLHFPHKPVCFQIGQMILYSLHARDLYTPCPLFAKAVHCWMLIVSLSIFMFVFEELAVLRMHYMERICHVLGTKLSKPKYQMLETAERQPAPCTKHILGFAVMTLCTYFAVLFNAVSNQHWCLAVDVLTSWKELFIQQKLNFCSNCFFGCFLFAHSRIKLVTQIFHVWYTEVNLDKFYRHGSIETDVY